MQLRKICIKNLTLGCVTRIVCSLLFKGVVVYICMCTCICIDYLKDYQRNLIGRELGLERRRLCCPVHTLLCCLNYHVHLFKGKIFLIMKINLFKCNHKVKMVSIKWTL